MRTIGRLYLAAVPVIGMLWVIGAPQWFGTTWLDGQLLPLCIGLGTAAGLIEKPYGQRPALLDVALGILALACWAWSAWNYDEWLISFADRNPEQWIPGVIALVLMLEAMRKVCGVAITVLVWAFVAYALFGHVLGSTWGATPQTPAEVVMYLYADSQGVPGFIVGVVVTLVLAFIVLGKVMEQSGATQFFTDLAMRLMAHRRGGAAKVSIVASGAFGMVNGSTVANVMSTGIVTIPLMKRSGFPANVAAAVEAVASNGGQLAPPVMGATAFLIAEFLEIEYSQVALAAALPALLYFVVVFVQVDGIARRLGIEPVARETGPPVGSLLKSNWSLVLPLVLLMVLLFALEMEAGRAALISGAVLLALSALRNRALIQPRNLGELLWGSGANLLPILLIGAGAGVVVGVLNSTGLGFQLSVGLAAFGEAVGLFWMLVLTAALSIILGMGMPTAAVYLVLSVVIAPVLVEFGVQPLAAHLFLFYFGALSMLTPPVAVASFVAAGLAEARFWRTSTAALKLAVAAYVLPFLWVYNPAIILEGSPVQIALAVTLLALAAVLLARGLAAGPNARVAGIAQILAAAGLVVLIGVGG
jgi:TRAP transporter 4TM/12TM fusion protein